MQTLSDRMTVGRLQTLFLALLLAVCAAVPLLLLRGRNAPVRDGVVDLHGIDLRGGAALGLRGDWAFFEGRLIVSELLGDAEPDEFVPVPSYMAGGSDSVRWGSYRVRLLNCPPETAVTVSLRGMPSAYRIFLNGQSVEKGGVVSRDPSTTAIWAGYTQEVTVPLRSSTCELVVEVSGRYLPGLSLTPLLMEQEHFARHYARYQAMVLLLFGMGALLAVAYAMDLLLTPHGGYSRAMLLAIALLLCRFSALGAVFSILTGDGGPGYDGVVLAANGAQLLSWAILLRLDYCVGSSIPLRSGFSTALCLLLTACLAAPALGTLSGDTRWWMAGDLAVGFMLVWRLCRRTKRESKTSAGLLLESGYLLLWLGCVLGDLAMAGYLPQDYKLSFCLGMVIFCLTVQNVDRRRMDGIQREALRAAQMEAQLQRAQTELALHQIKPHFLHNALMSIKVLCRTQPREAEQAVYDFALFLRSNMNAIDSTRPVPFVEEVRTIEGYLHIEQIRFGKRLRVAWDLRETDFLVPPLTIQPMVENAVCHGVCQKPEGGTVEIISRREGTWAVVEIRDDGVGFDVAAAERSGGIGLRHLRMRLREQVGASLEITSRPGVGTVQTVRIPVRGGETA